MLRAVLGRIGQAAATALAAAALVWALLPLAPGDPARRILEARGMRDVTLEEVAALRAELGLDEPLPLQFLHWLGGVLRGDLGTSFASGAPVAREIAERLPATLTLLGLALVIAVALSLALALLAAAWRDRWPDRAIRLYTQIGASLPTFVFALLALHAIVATGLGRVLAEPGFQAALLPAFVIGLDRAAGWTQLLRAGLLEAMEGEFAHVARARGATERRILLRHALPNAALPFLTAIGVSVGALIGGAPLIEAIFTWPGLGRHLLEALGARDFPVIQAYVLLAALAYVAAALLTDLAAMALDPRLRERRA